MWPGESAINEAVRILKAGGLVAVPTETVYGLAAHALDRSAVDRIFKAKGRPYLDPLIVHIAHIDQVLNLAENAPGLKALAGAFWPGPLTVVLHKHRCVPDLVTAGQPTVAIRMPGHPVFQAVLERSQLPLAAPSANPFGYISPTQASHVADQLGDKVDLILDGGPCQWGIESTVIQLCGEEPLVLRHGPILSEALERVLGRPVKESSLFEHEGGHQGLASPGLLTRHYSPRTAMHLLPHGTGVQSLPTAFNPAHDALILQSRPDALPEESMHLYWFSESGALPDVARALFALLRRLDKTGHKTLWVEKAPDAGLGLAINDRLTRAAAKS